MSGALAPTHRAAPAQPATPAAEDRVHDPPRSSLSTGAELAFVNEGAGGTPLL